MKQYCTLLLLFLLPFYSRAQGENDNWYFGNNAAVNFATPTPAVLTNSVMYALEACGSVSGSDGRLLFYTDGINIWNRDHQVMQNGSGLIGFFSSQQLVIVPHPGNASQYFVFTTGSNNAGGNDIAYSIVDMTLGNLDANGIPLGRVLDNYKNIPVTNGGGTFKSEAITVVTGPDGTYWILIPNGRILCSYKLDSLGFHNGTPVMSPLNFPATLTPPQHFSIKASSELNGVSDYTHYLCLSFWWDPGQQNKVYSFNNVTGAITNDYSLEISSINAYLPEFNRDASILYLGYQIIYAVDLLNSTPSSVNLMQIYDMGTNNVCGAIQRNKYNDIYISKFNSQFLGKIINPNVYSSAINVDMNNIQLGSSIFINRANHGLPQLVPMHYTYYPCISDLVLTTPETNNNFTYEVGQTIQTTAHYQVFPNQDITMKAGKNITLQPNTYIMNEAAYFATIEDCHKGTSTITTHPQKKMELFLELDKAEAAGNEVTVYPNPATDHAIIDTHKEQLAGWELYDILGKLVAKGNSNNVATKGLPGNTYLLKITTTKGNNSFKKLVVR